MNLEQITDFGLLSGRLEMTAFDNRDHSIVDDFGEGNVITSEGIEQLIKRLTTANDSTRYIYQFAIGNDVGSGDLFSPEAEDSSLTGSDQHVVYEVPSQDMTFEYPSEGVIRVSTILRGNDIMSLEQFSGEVDIRYTSVTSRFRNGKTLSYKRFPVRALSYYVDIAIVWTYNFSDAGCDSEEDIYGQG